MRVGIIAEGRGDLAVITNILKGWLGLDAEHVQFLRPEYALDQTDLHAMKEEEHSNWAIVKRECSERAKIDEFLESPIDEERLVVIHIDTAEASQPGYDVDPPAGRTPKDVVELRRRVVERVDHWLRGLATDRLRYAVAVQEMDAWVLTIFSSKDTAGRVDAKRDLLKAVNGPKGPRERERKKLFQMGKYQQYAELSRPFRSRRSLDECAGRNGSLRLFVDSL